MIRKKVQVQDRHEHGGLPETIRLIPANQGRMLYEVSVDDDGHATGGVPLCSM